MIIWISYKRCIALELKHYCDLRFNWESTMNAKKVLVSVFCALLFVGAVSCACNILFYILWTLFFSSFKNDTYFLGDPKQHKCPKWEKYLCGGSPCQTTCKKLGCECKIQTFAPVNGCYCIDGYARNSRGKCVKADSCDCRKEKLDCNAC